MAEIPESITHKGKTYLLYNRRHKLAKRVVPFTAPKAENTMHVLKKVHGVDAVIEEIGGEWYVYAAVPDAIGDYEISDVVTCGKRAEPREAAAGEPGNEKIPTKTVAIGDKKYVYMYKKMKKATTDGD